MSPNVGNFVHDLVEMAKAMETLPQVQAELSTAHAANDSLANQITALRADLEQSRNYAASLEQRNHDLEVQRDDAELRFLELEDKSVNILAMAKAARVSLDQMTGLLDPPKAEPEPVQPPIPEAVHSLEPQPQDQGEALPIEHSSTASGDGSTLGESSSPAPQPPASQDQSEVNPTQGQSSSGVTEPTGGEPKPSGPYTGKFYRDHPVYISLWDWIDGGGTEESYRYGR